MDKATVIKLRNLCYKATFTLYNKNRNCKPEERTLTLRMPVHILCDNSMSIIDDPILKNVVWDDDNEVFYYFTRNGSTVFPNSSTNSISFGDKVAIPCACILVDYGEIQNLRLQLNEEAFDKFTSQIPQITDEQKKTIKEKIFKETDMTNVIKRKQNVSFMTMTDKNSDPATRNYDDEHEYTKTVHPVSY